MVTSRDTPADLKMQALCIVTHAIAADTEQCALSAVPLLAKLLVSPVSAEQQQAVAAVRNMCQAHAAAGDALVLRSDGLEGLLVVLRTTSRGNAAGAVQHIAKSDAGRAALARSSVGMLLVSSAPGSIL